MSETWQVCTLGNMADLGERKENCHFSGLAAEEGKTFISKFQFDGKLSEDVGLE